MAEQAQPAEVGSLLFQTREGSLLHYVTSAREHGISWLPELQYSVINAFAETWACVPCCRCPCFGSSRPVNVCGFNFYRISFTRAQWLYAFNLICFLAHFTLYFFCITACNGDRFGTKFNTNCTAASMEIKVFRIRSVRAAQHHTRIRSHTDTPVAAQNWTSSAAGGYELTFVENNNVPIRFDYLAAWFHGLSALFHAAVVIVGPFDRFAYLYWKCIDDAFCWWRRARPLQPYP